MLTTERQSLRDDSPQAPPHATSLRVTQSVTRSSAGPSYGLPGQPETPRVIYQIKWTGFTPP